MSFAPTTIGRLSDAYLEPLLKGERNDARAVIEQALATRGEDQYGYRNEFVQLVRKAKSAR